ncbi:MAG TPA: YetF domain-containing protein [Allosphingosinicella sp.]|nr:YetF domain-containing protein [Allosphingosinicella sp.]
MGPLVRGLVLTAIALAWTIVMIRMVGLRSLSKMSAFDFVATIATGSLIATAATRDAWPDFAQALAALAAIFLVQWLLAAARRRSRRVRELVGNDPVLLVEDGRFIEAALAETRVTREEVLENLRAANVGSLAEVRAVVMETTGDISVLHRRRSRSGAARQGQEARRLRLSLTRPRAAPRRACPQGPRAAP